MQRRPLATRPSKAPSRMTKSGSLPTAHPGFAPEILQQVRNFAFQTLTTLTNGKFCSPGSLLLGDLQVVHILVAWFVGCNRPPLPGNGRRLNGGSSRRRGST